MAAFAEAARGPGVIPWHFDYARIEEDIFHCAVAARGGRDGLSIEGCHMLARQFRQRIEARDARATALIRPPSPRPYIHAGRNRKEIVARMLTGPKYCVRFGTGAPLVELLAASATAERR